MSDVVVVDEASAEVVRETQSLLDEAARTDGRSAAVRAGMAATARRPAPGRAASAAAARTVNSWATHSWRTPTPSNRPTGELVVHPAHRGQGYGRRLGQALLKRVRQAAAGVGARRPPGGPAPRAGPRPHALPRTAPDAAAAGRLAVPPLPEPVLPEGVTVRTFRPGEDDAAWLALNAAAFAHHPEQGSLTQRDLDDRKARAVVRPGGLLPRRAGRGARSASTGRRCTARNSSARSTCWASAPTAQGGGLGKALTAIGLRHLARDRGLPTAMLYVDADNLAAVRVYERLGFTTHEMDLMYRTES